MKLTVANFTDRRILAELTLDDGRRVEVDVIVAARYSVRPTLNDEAAARLIADQEAALAAVRDAITARAYERHEVDAAPLPRILRAAGRLARLAAQAAGAPPSMAGTFARRAGLTGTEAERAIDTSAAADLELAAAGAPLLRPLPGATRPGWHDSAAVLAGAWDAAAEGEGSEP